MAGPTPIPGRGRSEVHSIGLDLPIQDNRGKKHSVLNVGVSLQDGQITWPLLGTRRVEGRPIRPGQEGEEGRKKEREEGKTGGKEELPYRTQSAK